MSTTNMRWTATITYRTKTGPVDVIHDVDELEDVHDLVERGPHWDTIISIRIVRADADRNLTVEAANKL